MRDCGADVLIGLAAAILEAAPTVLALGSAWFLAVSVVNVLWLRLSARTEPARPPTTGSCPRVSVLVPARNEESRLEACLESLAAQTYPDYEVVVLDDESTDDTWEIMSRFAELHPCRFRAVRGAPLPASGWCGKAHAMQQLARHASGEVLLFTDADTIHDARSVCWAVANLLRHRADLLSGYTAQILSSAGEALVVPAMYLMTGLLLPLPLLLLPGTPALSFAIGQLMVFRRAAFEAVGGYAAVSDRISEDLAMARAMKSAGFRTVFLDASSVVRCRMYRDYRAAVEGIGKNVHDLARRSRGLFACGVVALVGFVLLPAVLLLAQLAAGYAPERALVLAATLFLIAWSLTLYDRGHPWWLPLTYPVPFLHLLAMAWRALRPAGAARSLLWKGRVLP